MSDNLYYCTILEKEGFYSLYFHSHFFDRKCEYNGGKKNHLKKLAEGQLLFNKPVVGTSIVRNHPKHATRIEMPREDYLTLIFNSHHLDRGVGTKTRTQF